MLFLFSQNINSELNNDDRPLRHRPCWKTKQYNLSPPENGIYCNAKSVIVVSSSMALCQSQGYVVRRMNCTFVTCLIAARCRNSATYANRKHHNERILWHEMQNNYFHRRSVICSIRSTIDTRRSRDHWEEQGLGPSYHGIQTCWGVLQIKQQSNNRNGKRTRKTITQL